MSRFARRLPLAVIVVLAACHHGAAPGTSAAPKVAVGPPRPAMPAGVTAPMIAQGDLIFHAQTTPCQRCHGPGGAGGTNGPSLVAGPWLQSDGSFPGIASTIINGVTADKIKDPAHRFAMNAHGGPMKLTDDQARVLASYVWSISRGKTH